MYAIIQLLGNLSLHAYPDDHKLCTQNAFYAWQVVFFLSKNTFCVVNFSRKSFRFSRIACVQLFNLTWNIVKGHVMTVEEGNTLDKRMLGIFLLFHFENLISFHVYLWYSKFDLCESKLDHITFKLKKETFYD